METMCFNITSLFFRKIFLQFGEPFEYFDIRMKLSLEFMVGLTTPSNLPPTPPPPGAKGLFGWWITLFLGGGVPPSDSCGVCVFLGLFVLLGCVLVLVASAAKACFWLLGCLGGVVDVVGFKKHFLSSATDVRSWLLDAA